LSRFCNEEAFQLALALKPAALPPAETVPFAGPAGVFTPCDVDAAVELTATVTMAAAMSAE
jgi:hypothetical protein